MTAYQITIIFLAGAAASALNSVAGGGSFISFPTLLFTGVTPVAANATNTLALWFGSVASGGAYRKHLNLPRGFAAPLILTSVVGGLAGALLLIHTQPRTFLLLIPWLLLGATLLFIFGGRLTGYLAGGLSNESSRVAIGLAAFLELLVGTYGGYFGAGIGIMNLALLASLGMTEIHAMNAINAVLGSTTNGVASVTFMASKTIFWWQAGVMGLGAILGGYGGAHYAQKVPKVWIRQFVIVVGFSMTAYFFYSAYR